MFIVRFHYFRDKEWVLRRGKDRQQLQYRGCSVHIFPDMTTDVAKNRAAFATVKRNLYAKGTKFALLFPARLRVDYQDGRKISASQTFPSVCRQVFVRPKYF